MSSYSSDSSTYGNDKSCDTTNDKRDPPPTLHYNSNHNSAQQIVAFAKWKKAMYDYFNAYKDLWSYAGMFNHDEHPRPKMTFDYPKECFLMDFKEMGLKTAIDNHVKRRTTVDEYNEADDWISPYRARLEASLTTPPTQSLAGAGSGKMTKAQFTSADDRELEYAQLMRRQMTKIELRSSRAFEELGYTVYIIIKSTFTAAAHFHVQTVPGYAKNDNEKKDPHELYKCIIKLFAGVVGRSPFPVIEDEIYEGYYTMKMLPNEALWQYLDRFESYAKVALTFLGQHGTDREDAAFSEKGLAVRFLMSINADYEGVRANLADDQKHGRAWTEQIQTLRGMFRLAEIFEPKNKTSLCQVTAESATLPGVRKRKMDVEMPEQRPPSTACGLCGKKNHVTDNCYSIKRAKRLITEKPVQTIARAAGSSASTQPGRPPVAAPVAASAAVCYIPSLTFNKRI
jgi:hypothetical protein